MRVAKDKFLIEVNDQFVRPNIKGLDFFDTDYNPKILATKIGKIHTLPISLSETYKYDIELKEGNQVVFNHIVCQDINKFKDNIFFADYFNIFAKIDNDEIMPLEDTLFCTKIKDEDLNIGGFEVEGKTSNKYAKVFKTSDYIKSEGIQINDIVFYTKNADYEIDVLGYFLYKMHLRNIIGIERDGKLETFRNKLLVKNITELESVGGLQRIYAPNTLQKGVVINSGTTNIEKGVIITYFETSASIVTWKGENYSFINEENIKYTICQ